MMDSLNLNGEEACPESVNKFAENLSDSIVNKLESLILTAKSDDNLPAPNNAELTNEKNLDNQPKSAASLSENDEKSDENKSNFEEHYESASENEENLMENNDKKREFLNSEEKSTPNLSRRRRSEIEDEDEEEGEEKGEGGVPEKEQKDVQNYDDEEENDQDYYDDEEDSHIYAADNDKDGRKYEQDTAELLNGERERGDGEEVPDDSAALPAVAKKAEEIEDRKNPTFVPKRGIFYQHDSRDPERTENATNEISGKKGVAGDRDSSQKTQKWRHDMFDLDEQSPKSKQELIDAYGYDIRCETKAPMGTRNRRYGRMPKRIRDWRNPSTYVSGRRFDRNRRARSTSFTKSPKNFPPLENTTARKLSDPDPDPVPVPAVDDSKTPEKPAVNSVLDDYAENFQQKTPSQQKNSAGKMVPVAKSTSPEENFVDENRQNFTSRRRTRSQEGLHEEEGRHFGPRRGQNTARSFRSVRRFNGYRGGGGDFSNNYNRNRSFNENYASKYDDYGYNSQKNSNFNYNNRANSNFNSKSSHHPSVSNRNSAPFSAQQGGRGYQDADYTTKQFNRSNSGRFSNQENLDNFDYGHSAANGNTEKDEYLKNVVDLDKFKPIPVMEFRRSVDKENYHYNRSSPGHNFSPGPTPHVPQRYQQQHQQPRSYQSYHHVTPEAANSAGKWGHRLPPSSFGVDKNGKSYETPPRFKHYKEKPSYKYSPSVAFHNHPSTSRVAHDEDLTDYQQSQDAPSALNVSYEEGEGEGETIGNEDVEVEEDFHNNSISSSYQGADEALEMRAPNTRSPAGPGGSAPALSRPATKRYSALRQHQQQHHVIAGESLVSGMTGTRPMAAVDYSQASQQPPMMPPPPPQTLMQQPPPPAYHHLPPPPPQFLAQQAPPPPMGHQGLMHPAYLPQMAQVPITYQHPPPPQFYEDYQQNGPLATSPGFMSTAYTTAGPIPVSVTGVPFSHPAAILSAQQQFTMAPDGPVYSPPMVYYSPENQQYRPAPPKSRPKSVIPIVAPSAVAGLHQKIDKETTPPGVGPSANESQSPTAIPGDPISKPQLFEIKEKMAPAEKLNEILEENLATGEKTDEN